MSGSSLALPLNCPRCGVSVTLESTDAKRDQVLDRGWMCPHCFGENRFSAPWRTAWAVKVSRPSDEVGADWPEWPERVSVPRPAPAMTVSMRDFVLWSGLAVAIVAMVVTEQLVVGIVGTAAELFLLDTLNSTAALGFGSSQGPTY